MIRFAVGRLRTCGLRGLVKYMEQGEERKTEEVKEEAKVTPIEVLADDTGVDYDKLITTFGCDPLTPDLVALVEAVTGHPAHRFLRRGIYFSHRDFGTVLKKYQAGKPFYLYTGRGPSSSALHLGHMIPFMFCKYLQDMFQVPLVVQITDDEKYLYRPELSLDEVKRYARENIKDIIAMGFDINKTFIFQDTAYIGNMYELFIQMQKHVTVNQINAIFGFGGSDNVGKLAYPPLQAVPCFPTAFPHIFGTRKDISVLIPDAIDQDPYFRMTRDIAPKMGFLKPSVVHAKFFPALQGLNTKMSASTDISAIFMTDTPKQIQTKINKYAFSGSGATIEEHKANGANLAVDVPFQYLTFFMEDDARLAEIKDQYSRGEMLTGQVKKELITILQAFVAEHQRKRAEVTEELVDEFMRVRPMAYP